MMHQWTIRGAEFVNCNCGWACPCQFHAPSTHGFCQAISGGIIEEGRFDDTKLDGLRFVTIYKWPGEIAEGNGQMQVIIDSRADANQREALRKILHGESTAPGATHFYVFNSTVTKVHDVVYAPIEIELDLEARRARVNVDGMVKSRGEPIVDPFSGGDHRIAIEMPNGFEYTRAEIGRGTTKVTAAIELEHTDSYGQFNVLHMNQDGVIR